MRSRRVNQPDSGTSVKRVVRRRTGLPTRTPGGRDAGKKTCSLLRVWRYTILFRRFTLTSKCKLYISNNVGLNNEKPNANEERTCPTDKRERLDVRPRPERK